MSNSTNLKDYIQNLVNIVAEKRGISSGSLNAQQLGEQIKLITGGGAEVYVEENSVVPTSGVVEKVHINTELSPAEVNAYLNENISFVDGSIVGLTGVNLYAVLAYYNNDIPYVIGFLKYSNGEIHFGLIDFSTLNTIQNFYISNNNWEEFTNPFAIGYEALPSLNGISIGTENDKLLSIISEIKTTKKKLTGQYDGASLEVTNNQIVNVENLLSENKLPLKINVEVPSIPEGYIKPEGKIEITSINEVDVTNYKYAQVVEENLKAGNIKKDVNILGVIGTLEIGDTSNEDGIIDGTLTEYTNDRVTSIRNYAFYYCTSLTSVDLPNVTSIGISAFSYCSSLTSASFPLVTSIGSNAFYKCSKLTSVSFPNVTSIGQYAFQQCSKLTSASFPLVTSIEQYAFQQCSKLTSVDLPNVTSIENYVFSSCSSLTSASFPLVTSIGSNSFEGCSSLTSVDLPKITSIENYVFSSCSRLTSASFPLVTSIGSKSFEGCSSLTSVDLPKVTSISNGSFFSCSKLTSVSFPNVTSIGQYAFQQCSKLTSVDLPKVTRISNGLFFYCYSLTKLILRANQVCTLSNTNAFLYCYHILGTTNSTYNPTGAKDGYIYVPDELVDSYKTATNWVTYASQIKPISELGE